VHGCIFQTIYLNSQTWAIMNNVADSERKKVVADAILEHLEGSVRRREYRTAYALADALTCHVNELRDKNLEKTDTFIN